MPPLLIVLLIGPNLFSIIFGEHWILAGVFAQWMVPWLYFQFIFSPISTIFPVLEKQNQLLLMNICMFILRFASLIIAGYLENFILGIALFSSISAFCYFVFLIITFYYVKIHFFVLIKKLFLISLYSLLICFPIIISNYVKLNIFFNAFSLIMTGILFIIYYIKIFNIDKN